MVKAETSNGRNAIRLSINFCHVNIISSMWCKCDKKINIFPTVNYAGMNVCFVGSSRYENENIYLFRTLASVNSAS